METEVKSSEEREFMDVLLGRKSEEAERSSEESSEERQEEQQQEEQKSEQQQEQQEGKKEEQLPQFDLNKLNDEQMLAAFRKITGTEATLDEAKRYKEVQGELSKTKDIREKFPLILEKFKQSKDVLSYFEDETAYKASQLAKEERFHGKKGAIEELLRSDLKTMGALDVVKLHAKLNAPAEVRNPFRHAIKGLGLDPDAVIDNYDELDDDDKDLFDGFAAKARKELSTIGTDIQVPQIMTDDIEKMLSDEQTAKKDDFNAKREQIMPVSYSYVGELKELRVKDDFIFKLDLSESEKNGYAETMTSLIQSGDFDVSTDEGKQELHQAIMDEIWLDKREEIVKAHETHLRTKLEQEFRIKYNNEVPFDDKSKKPEDGKVKVSPELQLIRSMISERK